MLYITISILLITLASCFVYFLFIRKCSEKQALKAADKTVKSLANIRLNSLSITTEDNGAFWVVTYGDNAIQVIVKKSNGKTVECYNRSQLQNMTK